MARSGVPRLDRGLSATQQQRTVVKVFVNLVDGASPALRASASSRCSSFRINRAQLACASRMMRAHVYAALHGTEMPSIRLLAVFLVLSFWVHVSSFAVLGANGEHARGATEYENRPRRDGSGIGAF